MKQKFELQPLVGVGPVRLGMDRAAAIARMGIEPVSFMKTPACQHPTDAFFEAGFQIFYVGDMPQVDCLELSRGCGFQAVLFGLDVLDRPVEEVLRAIEAVSGIKPGTADGGYTYEISSLGVWLWRPSIDGDEARYFSTVGISAPCT